MNMVAEIPNNTINPQLSASARIQNSRFGLVLNRPRRLFEAGAYLKNNIFDMKTYFSYSLN